MHHASSAICAMQLGCQKRHFAPRYFQCLWGVTVTVCGRVLTIYLLCCVVLDLWKQHVEFYTKIEMIAKLYLSPCSYLFKKYDDNIKLQSSRRGQTSARTPSWILSKVIFHAKIAPVGDCQSGEDIYNHGRGFQCGGFDLELWPWPLKADSELLQRCWTSASNAWKSYLYFSGNHKERHERTNEPTNQPINKQTFPIKIPPAYGQIVAVNRLMHQMLNKLWCESTTNPAPCCDVAKSITFSVARWQHRSAIRADCW